MALRDAWTLFRKVERVLELEEAHGKAIDELKSGFTDLDRRLARLEHREDLVVNEAKSAARAASYEASQGTVADLARRIGALEATAPRPRRLPKPKPA